MIQKINFKFTVYSLLILSGIVVLFHLLVLSGAIPFNIVWGGRLQNVRQMYIFEGISIIVNLFIIAVIMIKGELIKNPLSVKTITVILWVLTGLFALNTLGNIFSKANLETIVFTPITFINSILFYRLATHKPAK